MQRINKKSTIRTLSTTCIIKELEDDIVSANQQEVGSSMLMVPELSAFLNDYLMMLEDQKRAEAPLQHAHAAVPVKLYSASRQALPQMHTGNTAVFHLPLLLRKQVASIMNEFDQQDENIYLEKFGIKNCR